MHARNTVGTDSASGLVLTSRSKLDVDCGSEREPSPIEDWIGALRKMSNVCCQLDTAGDFRRRQSHARVEGRAGDSAGCAKICGPSVCSCTELPPMWMLAPQHPN